MDLDKIDRKILAALQADGRVTNAELAERVHLSPSACLRRVRQLEAAGVIEGYSMVLNHAALGKPTNIFIEISLHSQSVESLDAFEKAVLDCPEVIECYLMSGDSDYLLRIVAADASDYERVHRTYLSRLPGVSRIRSNFALRPVTRRTGMQLL